MAEAAVNVLSGPVMRSRKYLCVSIFFLVFCFFHKRASREPAAAAAAAVNEAVGTSSQDEYLMAWQQPHEVDAAAAAPAA